MRTKLLKTEMLSLDTLFTKDTFAEFQFRNSAKNLYQKLSTCEWKSNFFGRIKKKSLKMRKSSKLEYFLRRLEPKQRLLFFINFVERICLIEQESY